MRLTAKPNEVAKTSDISAPCEIVILVDLSDRISPIKHPGQANKDITVINNLLAVFEDMVQRQMYLMSKDSIRIEIAPQQSEYAQAAPTLVGDLRIDMRQINDYAANKAVGKPGFDQAMGKFKARLNQLYDMAQKNARFEGADIWAYFRDRYDYNESDGGRKIVIILTDGYIDFDQKLLAKRPVLGNMTSYMRVEYFRNNKDWERLFEAEHHGLMPIERDFKGLEAYIIEVAYRSLADKPIVAKYWLDWLSSMNVDKVVVHSTQDDPSVVSDLLERSIRKPSARGD
jgi:hypothetical protein